MTKITTKTPIKSKTLAVIPGKPERKSKHLVNTDL